VLEKYNGGVLLNYIDKITHLKAHLNPKCVSDTVHVCFIYKRSRG